MACAKKHDNMVGKPVFLQPIHHVVNLVYTLSPIVKKKHLDQITFIESGQYAAVVNLLKWSAHVILVHGVV